MKSRLEHVLLVLGLVPAAACAIAPVTEGLGSGSAVGIAPPPGYGTLRQEDVSLFLTSGDLQLMVTPLHESVTHVTAPDTEMRLSGLVAQHAPEPGSRGEGLFLVSFYSDQPDIPFEPDEVQIISRGLRARPRTIVPITPSWGQRRVGQRQTEMAVYWFGDTVDLESPLTLAYRFEQTDAWNDILPRVQAERARARARAGLQPQR